MQKLVRDYLNELKRKQKKQKRVGTAVVLLVILVIGTVIGGLTQAGVAMTGRAKCGIEEHEHSDGCYENVLACGQEEGEGHQHGEGCYETQSTLTCGMDETEGHQHDDSCYDEAGNLICGTEEAAGHQHDDSCYTTEEVLTCEQEEGEGHTHSDACYEKELICKKEEHTHTEECYIDKKADVEESSKWDEQYKDTEWKETWAENLVIAAEAQIGYKESEDNYEVAEDGSHKGYTRYGQFMDDVYADWDAAFVNFCMHYAGKDDMNIEASEVFPKETEAVKWYEEFTKADEKNMSYLVAPQGYEPKAGELVFFDRKDEEPAFQMGIVSSYDEEKNEIKVIEGNSDNEVKENEYGIKDEDIEENHIFAYLKMDEVEEAYKASKKTDTEENDQKAEEDQKDENETSGDPAEAGQKDAEKPEETVGTEEVKSEEIQKVYTSEKFTVTASYPKEANIPEEAEFKAEEVAAEGNEEHYAEREAEFKKAMGDEKASMKALLKVGFYVNGEEVEPESPVTLTIQFLDENGLKEGSPVTVVHFAEKGTEVLDGGKAKDNSATFQMGSFSEIAIGEGMEVESESKDQGEIIPLNKTFEYKEDTFHVTFRVVGNALLEKAADTQNNGETESGQEGVATEGNAENDDKEETVAEGSDQEGTVVEENAAGETDEQSAADIVAGEGEPQETDKKVLAEEIVAKGKEKEQGYQFKIEFLDETSEEYKDFTDYADEVNDGYDRLMLQVMKYSMYYEDTKLDLSDCKITAKITPTETLKEYAKELEQKEDADSQETSKPEEKKEEENSTGEDASLTSEFLGKMQTGELDTDSKTEKMQTSSLSVVNDAGDTGDDDRDEDVIEREIVVSAYVQEGGVISRQNSVIMTENNEITPMTVSVNQDDVMAMSVDEPGNNEFTVQYYANLKRLATTGTNSVPVIDTSGKKLPVNGKGTGASPNDNEIKNIYVDNDGNIQYDTKATEVYNERYYKYYQAPSIRYFNALVDNTNYVLNEIWVLKDELKPVSEMTLQEKAKVVCGYEAKDTHKHNSLCKDKNGNLLCKKKEGNHEHEASCYEVNWEKKVTNYQAVKDNIHFTNRKDENIPNDYIYIGQKATLRLVYGTPEKRKDIAASFYDYDISTGGIYGNVANAINGDATGKTNTSKQTDSQVWYAHTKAAGINSDGNYTGSGTKLAFGNVNTGTTYGQNLWGGNLLNKFNGTQGGYPTVNGAYKGCTFGLVTGQTEDGKLQYASGVSAPKLFNEGDATGKTSYDNYTLKFINEGDTHTLTAVNDTGAIGLEKFGHPSPNSTTTHTHIWTNDFWPMDDAASYGTDTHDMKFGSYANRGNRAYAGSNTASELGSTSSSKQAFPYSDDGQDHNSYFGMRYQVEFELLEDYIGPLEYYFFGDDDMWVFLDNTLVCDIGGVHSSVGEYVNLWDYLEKGSEGKHKLTFYYTERGASGSTCWMQFTLPSVSSLTPETSDKDYGTLQVSKKVKKIEDSVETGYASDNSFEFKLYLMDSQGNPLKDDYSYAKYENGNLEADPTEYNIIKGTISDGTPFSLKHGERIVVKFIPQGTRYKIVENTGTIHIGEIDYTCDTSISIANDSAGIKDEANKEVTGGIVSDQTSEVEYTNKFTVYKLPSTGGSGIYLYMFGGVLLMAAASLITYRNKRREVLRS